MNSKLATLLERADIWQSSAPQQPRHSVATRYDLLDSVLHQGDWPTKALTELLCDQLKSPSGQPAPAAPPGGYPNR